MRVALMQREHTVRTLSLLPLHHSQLSSPPHASLHNEDADEYDEEDQWNGNVSGEGVRH